MSDLNSWEDDPAAQDDNLSRQTQQMNLNNNPQQGGSFRPAAANFQPGAQSFQPGQNFPQYGGGAGGGYPQGGYQQQQNYYPNQQGGGYGGYPQQYDNQQGGYNQYQGGFNQFGNQGGYNQGGYREYLSPYTPHLVRSRSHTFVHFSNKYILKNNHMVATSNSRQHLLPHNKRLDRPRQLRNGQQMAQQEI
jgi:hypothetical protein